MANFELISTYKDEDAEWLESQGCPRPAVRPGNRMPTTAEMKWALEDGDEFEFDFPRGDDEELSGSDTRGRGFMISGFDWERPASEPDEYIKMRGSGVLLSALIRLSGRCGQLFLYPDSGAPPIIIEPGLDAEAVKELYDEACELEDGLEFFYEQMYGPDGITSE